MSGMLTQSLLNLYTSWPGNLDPAASPRSGAARQAGKTPQQPGPMKQDAAVISPQAQQEAGQTGENASSGAAAGTQQAGDLSQAEQNEVRELKGRDAEVHAHEQAHLAAAGNLARGGAKFEYKTGPDGQRYAIGGEVNIDTSPVDGDPQATMAKAQRIQRAAMAPADPSPQDRSVAAEAAAMAVRAQQELSRQKAENGGSRAGAAYAASSAPGSKTAASRINIQI